MTNSTYTPSVHLFVDMDGTFGNLETGSMF